jgi:hypothetical protein
MAGRRRATATSQTSPQRLIATPAAHKLSALSERWRPQMRTLIVLFALLLSLLVPNLADAQRSTMPGASTGGRQAPVGHRQPAAKDAPPDQSATNDNSAKSTDTDRALDKALKGICHGC